MKWVTRDHPHIDRVASPWLIKRFVDTEAEFVFVGWGKDETLPAGATPFAIPGAELGPHDDAGSTFDKIRRKYELHDPALELLSEVIDSAIHHSRHKGQPDQNDVPAPEGIGLDVLSEGMMYAASNDNDIIEKSLPLYDALYAALKARVLAREDPSLAKKNMFERTAYVKAALGR